LQRFFNFQTVFDEISAIKFDHKGHVIAYRSTDSLYCFSKKAVTIGRISTVAIASCVPAWG
jgi:hypothetical protein